MKIYKICTAEEWTNALAAGVFDGTDLDQADGFLHCSAGNQVAGTLKRFYADAGDLFLLQIDGERPGPALKWEAAGNGDAFPHIYAPLPLSAIERTIALHRGVDGAYDLPPLSAAP